MSANVSCLMSLFASSIIATERWQVCEDDPNCLCGQWGEVDPLCAPPHIVEEYCGGGTPTKTAEVTPEFVRINFFSRIFLKFFNFF